MNAPISSNGFNLQPANLDEAMNLADMLAKSNMVPKDYKGKKENTLIAMMMGSELGLNPIQAIQNIAVINGKPAIYGDALLALMQKHPSYGGMEESFDTTTMTASCTVWRKGGPRHTQTFSKDDAVRAGLWDNRQMIYSSNAQKEIPNPAPWYCYPKRMLGWRARTFSIRDQFADALAGLITVEEAQDIPEEINITPAKPIREALPSIYPQDQFDENLAVWGKAIKSNKRTPDEIITMVTTKGTLTEDQQKVIRSIKPEQQA